jgi:MoxR-like ATPase
MVEELFVSEALLTYLQELLSYSRRSPDFTTGLSPRAGLAMLRAARAWALMSGRDQVLPEDLQAISTSVIGHRMRSADQTEQHSARSVAERLIEAVPIP